MRNIDLRHANMEIKVGSPGHKALSIIRKLPVLEHRKQDIELSAHQIGIGSILIGASDSRGPRSKPGGKKKSIRSLYKLRDSLAKAAAGRGFLHGS
jgi:hypothetical protein